MRTTPLIFAYAANIAILVPVVWSMLFGSGTSSVFEGHVRESEGLRLLVGSLWFAILCASAMGLIWPSFFAPVLVIQIIYKSTWLLMFVVPLYRYGGWEAVPSGITTVFVGIVVTYPFLLWIAVRGGE